MYKHMIFLIHGMGENPVGWSASIQRVIEDAYNLYDFSRNNPFPQRYIFQEICYDDVLDEYRTKWKDQAGTLLNRIDEGLAGAGVAAEKVNLEKLHTAIESAGRESFISTHLLDVILYRLLCQPIAHI